MITFDRHLAVTDRSALALLLVLAISLVSAGCGFRLRGTIVLPPVMEHTLLQTADPEGRLAGEVRAVLTRAGATLVTEADQATSILILGQEQLDRRVSSVDSLGRATEYELLYNVPFSLRDAEGAVIVPQQWTRLSRLYRFDADNVLGASSEEDLLRGEMRSLAAQQMLRQLRVQVVNQRVRASPAEPVPPAPGQLDPAVETAP